MENLLSTWCYMSLFLQWMLCLETKFVGHGEKSCLRSWWALRIGVASCLFIVQSIAHKFTFWSPMVFFLQIIFPISPKFITCNCKKWLIIISVFVMFLWNYRNLWTTTKFCDYLTFTKKTTYNGLFDLEHGAQDGIFPYILGEKDFLLLLIWFMIPQKQNINARHIILEASYNKHHSRGRSLIENVFGISKKTFK